MTSSSAKTREWRSTRSAWTPSRLAWALSAAATLAWLVFVVAGGLTERVLHHWEVALTMLFGSFLAGSSPEGGGAVAFPVLTKALDVPGPVARTFGLSIQAVGMTMASIAILANRRPIHVRAAIIGSLAGVVGFAVSVAMFSQPDVVFWPSTAGVGWIKATFSIVLATTALLMWRRLRRGDATHETLAWTPRMDVAIVAVGLAGGLLSSLAGTGANILVFLVLVVLIDVSPKMAVPTVVIVMATVSIVGFVLYGLVDGQLWVEVSGDRVVSVGGTATDLPAAQTDLLGMWLAAIPVVVWGAPLGSWCAAVVRERYLVRFIALLAAVEVATTFLLVPELRTDPVLFGYLAAGLVLLPVVLIWLQRHRLRVFNTTPIT
jgi:uncharacterized membrane protein YfcA